MFGSYAQKLLLLHFVILKQTPALMGTNVTVTSLPFPLPKLAMEWLVLPSAMMAITTFLQLPAWIKDGYQRGISLPLSNTATKTHRLWGVWQTAVRRNEARADVSSLVQLSILFCSLFIHLLPSTVLKRTLPGEHQIPHKIPMQ